MKRFLTQVPAIMVMVALPGPNAATDTALAARGNVRGCGRIVYSTYSSATGRSTVRSIRADGKGSRTLFRSEDQPIGEETPVWSPDARRIAFLRQNYDRDADRHRDEVWVMGADGSKARRISSAGTRGIIRSLSWSPGANALTFHRESEDGDRPRMYVVELDGSERELGIGSDPVWSPNGEWIAYTTWLDEADGDIYLIRPDGTNQRRLTTDTDSEDAFPRWEPDSDGLVFLRYPDNQQNEYDGPYADVWSYELEEGLERQLTHDQDDYNGTEDPQVSANERWIAFEYVSDDYSAVALMRGDGSRKKRVRNNSFNPDWAPSSLRVVFETSRELKVYSLRTKKIRTLAEGGQWSYPDWAPC